LLAVFFRRAFALFAPAARGVHGQAAMGHLRLSAQWTILLHGPSKAGLKKKVKLFQIFSLQSIGLVQNRGR